MDGLFHGKLLLKWMIWGYHYFWKHPYILSDLLTMRRSSASKSRFRINLPQRSPHTSPWHVISSISTARVRVSFNKISRTWGQFRSAISDRWILHLHHHPWGCVITLIPTSARKETPRKSSKVGCHLNLSETCNVSHTFSQNADVLLNELNPLCLQKQISSSPTSLHINPTHSMPHGGRSTYPSRCDWARPEP